MSGARFEVPAGTARPTGGLLYDCLLTTKLVFAQKSHVKYHRTLQKAEAYWLIDLIISHQCKKEVNNERFQVWELKRLKNNVFTINATDGNKNKVANQHIPFSDFAYDQATIWLVDGCLMLPCEY